MKDAAKKIQDKIIELENQLEEELSQRANEFRYKIQDKKVTFEQEALLRHRALKTSIVSYIANARWLVIVTAPIIYSLIIPFLLLDLCVSIFQFICFSVYQIPKVKRQDYLIFDRAKLNYLNGIEKFNCLYCSYCNGLIAYIQEIAARTEQFWCPIKHALRKKGVHTRYRLFTDFGDAEQYKEKLKDIQKDFDN